MRASIVSEPFINLLHRAAPEKAALNNLSRKSSGKVAVMSFTGCMQGFTSVYLWRYSIRLQTTAIWLPLLPENLNFEKCPSSTFYMFVVFAHFSRIPNLRRCQLVQPMTWHGLSALDHPVHRHAIDRLMALRTTHLDLSNTSVGNICKALLWSWNSATWTLAV